MINLDDLTIGQLKQIQALNFGANNENLKSKCNDGLNCMIGKKVIVRTYSAGVWFGELEQKSGDEVILKNARRMWRWHTVKSISLSSVAIHGIDQSKSKICEAVTSQWLEAIEITPCTDTAIESLESAKNAKAQ
jgi:hypothetical protein